MWFSVGGGPLQGQPGRQKPGRSVNRDRKVHGHLLADLEKMELSSQEFGAALARFETHVAEHSHHEEAENSPLILESGI
jgi:hypothetical protein